MLVSESGDGLEQLDRFDDDGLFFVRREDYLHDTLKVAVSDQLVQPKYRPRRLSDGSCHLEVAAYELRQAASVLAAI